MQHALNELDHGTVHGTPSTVNPGYNFITYIFLNRGNNTCSERVADDTRTLCTYAW